MSKSEKSTWVTVLKELVEAILKAMGTSSQRPRTWHQHVVPYEDGWALRREGNKRITSKHRKQSTAIRKAQSIAKKRKSDVIIHRADGTIRDRMGYE